MRDARERLTIPVAAALTLGWLVALGAAIVRSDAELFIVATAPFGTLCGYLFVRNIPRTNGNGNGGPK